MKAEKIHEYYFHDVNNPPITIDRREFLKNLGGGVIIIFSLSQLGFISGYKGGIGEDLPEFNAYLRVKEDGRVDCYSGKIEMGQGINTSLAQVLADELEVGVDKIDMIMGDTELCPYDAGTWGSLTTRFHDPLIRAAAAEAREVLKKLASEKLDVPVAQLKAENGIIFVESDKNKRVTYAELTKGQKIIQSISEKPVLKKPGDFKIIGNSHLRTDSLQKVTGKALYSADIHLPGLLHARIVRPPAHGSKLISVDTSAAEAIPGVQIKREDDFIVVLHTSHEIAERAVRAVKADWEKPASKANNETIFEHIVKTATDSKVRHESGKLETGKKSRKFFSKMNIMMATKRTHQLKHMQLRQFLKMENLPCGHHRKHHSVHRQKWPNSLISQKKKCI
ncbi:hypothetical protein MASR2M47_12840 [Draconibacterium sp.]